MDNNIEIIDDDKQNKKTKRKTKKNIIIEDESEEKVKINKSEKKVNKSEKTIDKNTSNKKLLVKDIDLDANIKFQKPFLKWVGGKTQIINQIVSEFPLKMDNYYEIFLGGGSVLLALLSLQKEKKITIKNKIYAYDYNKPLIYIYKNIQSKPKKFIKSIKTIIDQYNDLDGNVINRKPNNINEAKTSQESYFYWIRKQYNELNDEEKLSVLGSAYFVFLNKTCFRGVFRLGKNGNFNVPFGHYSNPSIIDEENINEISELIKDVEFTHASFEDSLKNIKSNSYVYLDPVYVKLDKNSFVDYTADGFNEETHKKLFKMLDELKKDNVKWMMSNSHTKLVLDSFNDNKKYSVEKILCRRAINSKNPESKVNEVIIKSY